MKEKWTTEDKQRLIELYPIYSLRELEIIFKRSDSAISRQALLLGVRKYPRNGVNCVFDVNLKLVNIQYRVMAKNRTEAKRKALLKLAESLHRRNDMTELVCMSQSTVNKIQRYEK